ncbi:MAG: GNAT family N-acetyltransferase [Lachnospiraceae bacterium]|nr:GNAT family N-acetyltransferase [Lachnospiraceae bacterium]
MKIRELQPDEYEVLEDFLYEAIFVPEGVTPPSREILEKPELRLYIDCFGFLEGDNCLVAEEDGKIVGACWTRIMEDYGHVDNYTPSFAISLYPEYRGRGIGTKLMTEMLKILKKQGYEKASLAVQKSNYAVKMYRKTGFEIVDENEEEYIMVCGIQGTTT